MPAESFFAPCEQPVYEAVGVSADGVFVGALSEECRLVDVSDPDFLRRILSGFVKVRCPDDVLSFCRTYGFPSSLNKQIPQWQHGWLPCVSVRLFLDLAASYRLLFELVQGLMEDETLLFENLVVLKILGATDADEHLVCDYLFLNRSDIVQGLLLAKEMQRGRIPEGNEPTFLCFYPRGYELRWSGRVKALDDVLFTENWHMEGVGADFHPYRLPPDVGLPITAVRNAAALAVKGVLNLMLTKIHPCTEYESNQLKTYFRLPSMEHGMIWVLYSLLTGAVSLARCPHPSCGALYSKKGKQGCCGSERCQKWVSRQKKKIGGAK
ncbi:MAG: hypothetical protein IPK73_16510 [Candidatus Obscuribacter sp.]|nr:hypothetical protein [Candidatus Obscuribacter sp.]MBK9278769.1 hypothetical protein [Candidatus Obscuribacter sp.]